LKKENFDLKKKIKEFEEDVAYLKRERDAKQELQVETKKKRKKEKNESLQIFRLNEEKINEKTMQYWFGIEEFDVLVREWRPYFLPNWKTLFSVRIFLIWL
jgi:hypothetical protein